LDKIPLRMTAKEKIRELLALANIKPNGPDPWDLQVHDERFYQRALGHGSVGVGESYVDGWWDAADLNEFFYRIHSSDLARRVRTLDLIRLGLRSALFNLQKMSGSKQVARQHYDIGNDLYRVMLDRNMQYTCGYWKNANDLDDAQEGKLHLICRKLHLKPGMRVLELGGGFCGLARFMAKEYGCDVVTYNISKEQVAFGREFCADLPVRIEERDYREAVHEKGHFDRVAAIGLCEHIGYRNYRPFLQLVRAKLKDTGLFLLHTIGGTRTRTSTDPWIDKYIFPNGMLPSIPQLGEAMENLFIVEDWHNFGPDYVKTLMAWWKNFEARYCTLDKQRYDQRFFRMWKLYLMMSAGGFRARRMQLWQLVLSKGDVASYEPVR
jgi:cyclopropane-fatty-acyl-phospholipid synthase